MDVHIDEVTSSVSAVDGEGLLSGDGLARIVQAVLAQLRAEEARQKRLRAERHVPCCRDCAEAEAD